MPPNANETAKSHRDVQQSSRLVLALTGPVGSGVSTVAGVLESHGFKRLNISTAIKDTLRKSEPGSDALTFSHKRIPNWRQKLQDIGDKGRNEHGLDYWLKVALNNAPADSDLVIDGVRNLGEVNALRSKFPNC